MSALSQIKVPDGTTYEFKDSGALRAAAAAPEFSDSTAYAVGDAVTKDGILYRCTAAHAAGAWNSSHFAALDQIQAQLDALNAGHRYAIGPTITASATLADRTVNRVAPAANNSATITLSFPAAVSGKVRDFLVLVTNTTGNTGDIAFSPPSGATVLGDGFEDGVESGETRLYMVTEVESNTFYVKSVDPEGGGSSGGGSSGAAAYGTVTIVSQVAAGSDQTVSVDGKTYANSGKPYAICVPNGKTVTVSFGGYSSDSSMYKNGASTSNTASFTMETGDAWTIVFNTCLAPDTPILMADGTEKPLRDVRVGDMVASPYGTDRVTEVSAGTGDATDVWTFDDGTVVKTVGRHRFYNTDLGEPMYLEAWNIGEHALRSDGEKTALVKHERIEGPAPHMTLFTQDYNLYYAGGKLAGNRRSECCKNMEEKAWRNM